jgi:hypothetical protein
MMVTHMMRYLSLDEIMTYPDRNCIDGVEYFEAGCLCIRSGKLSVLFDKSPQEQFYHYLQGCRCSRHIDGELK